MMIHEWKPETDEERLQKKKEKEEKLVFKNVTFQEATGRIGQLIFNTMMRDRIRIDSSNPKQLGGVSFWIDYQSGSPTLMYNLPPKKWDRDAVITALENEEYAYLSKFNRF